MPLTLKQAVETAGRRLEESRTATPKLTAEVLLCHVLGRERSYLYGHPEQELETAARAALEDCLTRRLAGEPTQYITGVQEFYGRDFQVTPEVMIPRPETEFVVETALELCRDAGTFVDVGAGSGAIGITVQLETGTRVVATDISKPALSVAAENARRLGSTAAMVACDLLSALAPQSVDAVLSNPPYVPLSDGPTLQREVRDYEPALALYGGETGLDFYRRLIDDSPRVLRPGGWLIFELGIRQVEPVRAMLDVRWQEVKVIDDLAGLPRVLAARHVR